MGSHDSVEKYSFNPQEWLITLLQLPMNLNVGFGLRFRVRAQGAGNDSADAPEMSHCDFARL